MKTPGSEQTEVVIQIGPEKKTYRLWRTTASERYDYGSVIEVCRSATPDKLGHYARVVLIEESYLGTQQRERYASGLHTPAPVPEWEIDAQTVVQTLWDRLIPRPAL